MPASKAAAAEPSAEASSPVPDVSVVVAVYNTMPYLTRCLDSLIAQSIGTERLEVVAVDDGSTDGGAEELDKYAERFPDVVRVHHQANSGGPAAPSNVGLELARGRYVFFIGADDYLGEESLERMVAAADEHGSDVVAGRMVGVGGKGVSKLAFERLGPDVDLYDSNLPWAVSNTKLFRRELIERHRLRYPEDMPFGSDQPFTIEAMVRAAKITVLGDYDYYFAVRRDDDSNITYSSDHLRRLECLERIMGFVAGLLETGPKRDAVLTRHFHIECANLLKRDFLDLDETVQRRVVDRLGALADQYLTDRIRDRLAVQRRLRACMAQQRDLPRLRELIGAPDRPAFTVEDRRVFCRYPGFREPDSGLPDRCFELLDETALGRVAHAVGPAEAFAESDGLRVRVRIAIDGAVDASAGAVRVDGAVPGPEWHESSDRPVPEAAAAIGLEPDSDGGTAAAIALDWRPLADASAKWSLRLALPLAGRVYEVPVTVGGERWTRTVRRGVRAWKVGAGPDRRGRLVVTVAPVAFRTLALRRLRRALRTVRPR